MKGRRSRILKTIASVVENNLCTGCGTCAAICPPSAIVMQLNMERGEFRPEVDLNLCKNCGLCFEVCPGHSVNLGMACRDQWYVEPTDKRLGHYLSGQIAYAQDEDIRHACSSGGMVTALLIEALKTGLLDGAVVTRMCKDVPWQPEVFIARSPEEILSASGSKYCPVPINLVLREIMKNEGRYALVGLPCHIYAFRLAQQRLKHLKERVVLTLGLFCAAGPSFRGLEAFLQQAGLKLRDLASISYRGKGWPGNMQVKTIDGRLFRCSYEAGYPFMRLNDIYRCMFCADKSAELADLSFGDLWLPEERVHIGSGKSVVIARSSAGVDLLDRAVIHGRIKVEELDQNRLIRAVNPYNKKVGAAARLQLAKFFGLRVPSIDDCGLQPYSLTDLLKSATYLGVQAFCRVDLLRRFYLLARPKYRKFRKRIIEEF